MKNKKIIIAAIAIVVLIAIMAGIYFATRPDPVEGEKSITVTVIHSDGTEKVFRYRTDAKTLSEVLCAEGLIRNEGADAGMYDVVDGEKADFNVDGSYWAMYEGEEYAMVGADEMMIEDGDTFKFVYTVYAG